MAPSLDESVARAHPTYCLQVPTCEQAHLVQVHVAPGERHSRRQRGCVPGGVLGPWPSSLCSISASQKPVEGTAPASDEETEA